MALVRVSPGLYRNTATGKIQRGNAASPLVPKKKLQTPNTGAGAKQGTGTTGATGGGIVWDDKDTSGDGNIVWKGKSTNVTGEVSPPVPATPAPPVSIDAGVEPVTDPAVDQAAKDKKIQDMMDILMGEFKTFQDSPYYNQQVDAINKRNAAWAAARGLTGSGFEQQTTSDDLASLDASEQTRADQLGQARAQRLYDMLLNEQQRNERAGNTQFTRLMDLLKTGLDYSNSSLDNALKGITATNSLKGAQARDLASYLAQAYKKIYGGGSGGGGGSFPTNLNPASPDFSIADLAKITGDASTNSGYADIFKNILSSIF